MMKMIQRLQIEAKLDIDEKLFPSEDAAKDYAAGMYGLEIYEMVTYTTRIDVVIKTIGNISIRDMEVGMLRSIFPERNKDKIYFLL